MGSAFEWDRKKAAQNLKKHGVSFEEASTAFCDPYRVTIVDTAHSTADEQRFVTLGQSSKGRTLVVVHTEEVRAIRPRCPDTISVRVCGQRKLSTSVPHLSGSTGLD